MRLNALVLLLTAALLALLLSACVGPSAQGVPMPPRPPGFNPAQDAPITIGQPGHRAPRPQVEPGPKPSRVLPQTPDTRREPGIWAGTPPPMYPHNPPEPWQTILSPILPPEQDGSARLASSACMRAIQDAADRLRFEAALVVVSPDPVRKCMVYRIYAECLIQIVSSSEGAKQAGVAYDMRFHDAANRANSRAQAGKQQACKGVETDIPQHRAWVDLANATISALVRRAMR